MKLNECSKLSPFIILFFYIYIFIAIALTETSILVAFHFSMKNIYQSCDLCHAGGGATSTSASNFVCLLMFA